MGVTLIFKNKERHPLGNNANGRIIPPEKGRSAIYVPSFGVLEKEEIDDVVLAAQEKEDTRIKKEIKRPTQERLEAITQIVLQAPEGERAKVARELIQQKERHI